MDCSIRWISFPEEDLVKHWQQALADIRVLGPDIPAFRKDVQFLYGYIERVETERDEAREKCSVARKSAAINAQQAQEAEARGVNR